ncbi:MAG: hypothetical protein Q4G09_05225, partial [Clostridia bacterium]|nr:hypothetical protein [Clostridia bacterium]
TQETTQQTTQTTTQQKKINLIKENSNITQVKMAKKLDLTRDGISYNILIITFPNFSKKRITK